MCAYICVFTVMEEKKKIARVKGLGHIACMTVSSRLELSWPVIRISHLETSVAVTHTFCLNTAAQPPPTILHSSQHPAPIPHGSYRRTHNLQLVRVSVCSRHPIPVTFSPLRSVKPTAPCCLFIHAMVSPFIAGHSFYNPV